MLGRPAALVDFPPLAAWRRPVTPTDVAAPVQRLVWGVAALVQAVGDALASRFGAVTVHGELSGFSRAGSGHCYFSLKDADGRSVLLRCAMFRRAALLLDFTPSDGQAVQLRGRVGIYEARGELQFIVEAMQRRGDGTLFERFLRLKAKLEADGLFDASRKRPLPAFPRRLGIVTSLGAAALHDVATVLARRSPHVGLLVYPSPVQGADAPAALAAAITRAGRRAGQDGIDVLLLVRGGGSLEDLWAFNDEAVVRAIVGCPLPVVSGVGHETDVTLADFAADLRAPTPSAAAELAVAATQDLRERLQQLDGLLSRRVRHWLDGQSQRLDRGALRLARLSDVPRRQRERLRLLAHRLDAAARALPAQRARRLQAAERGLRQAGTERLRRHDHRLARLATRLAAVDPKAVTRRGYAWLTDASGNPVRSVAGLSVGQPVRAVLADGEAAAVVTALSGPV